MSDEADFEPGRPNVWHKRIINPALKGPSRSTPESPAPPRREPAQPPAQPSPKPAVEARPQAPSQEKNANAVKPRESEPAPRSSTATERANKTPRDEKHRPEAERAPLDAQAARSTTSTFPGGGSSSSGGGSAAASSSPPGSSSSSSGSTAPSSLDPPHAPEPVPPRFVPDPRIEQLTASQAAFLSRGERVYIEKKEEPWLPEGYEYTLVWVVGDPRKGDTPESVMAELQTNPGRYFPFKVVGYEEGDVSIKDGRVFNLVGPRAPAVNEMWIVGPIVDYVDSPNYVVVQRTSPTSFTFRTSDSHFDGPNALITFTTFQARDGSICLEQSGYAPKAGLIQGTFAPIGALAAWKIQATNLKYLK